MKLKMSLKVFITITITTIVSLVTLFIVNYYTDIIKHDVYNDADRKVRELFQKDKLTYIRLIQLGSYLELGQQLQLNFQNEDIIQEVEIRYESEKLASFKKYQTKGSERFSHLHFPLSEHGQTWGTVAATVDLTSFNQETKNRIKELYRNALFILISSTVLAFILASFISKEIRKISITITDKFNKLENVSTMEELESQMSSRKYFPSIIKEVNFINKMIGDFIDLIRKTNLRIHGLEDEARISRIAQDLSHDLHSPLAALDLIADTLEDQKAEVVKLASQRIKVIINDLDIERKKRGHTLINLKEVISKCLSLKEKEFKNLNFDTTKLASVSVLFNEDKFIRIVSNLINNSFEAQASSITISTQQLNDKVIISFQDNGKGIPAHLLDSILVRGFTYGKSNGSGLGLTQANQEIYEAGGEIKISSTQELGTEISIYLPKQAQP